MGCFGLDTIDDAFHLSQRIQFSVNDNACGPFKMWQLAKLYNTEQFLLVGGGLSVNGKPSIIPMGRNLTDKEMII